MEDDKIRHWVRNMGEDKHNDKEKEAKLNILNQTRDRTPMPRPAVFRDKKKYDRNAAKEEARKSQEQDE